MDTPEKTQKQQLGTPLSSRFEDSPVFNYINSLSPIKPVKSIHFGQTFNSINFASIPSVFTSPHASVQKESRFLARQPLSDLSKPQFSPDLNRDESSLGTGVSDVVKISDSAVVCDRVDGKMTCSLNRAVSDPPEECSTDPSSQYNSGSPDHNIQPQRGGKSNFKLVMGSTSLIEFIHDGLDERSVQTAPAIELERKHGAEEAKQASACDWGAIMSNNNRDLLIFDSSQEPEPLSEMDEYCPDGDSKLTSLPDEAVQSSQEFQRGCPLYVPHQRFLCDLPHGCNTEIAEDAATDHTPVILSAGHNNPVTVDPCEKVEDENCSSHDSESKVESQNQRGLRRRCLVFEWSGAHRKSLHNTLSKSTPTPVPCYVKLSSEMEEATSSKGGAGLPDCFLPGVGLHLNSLATMSKDAVIIEDNRACGTNLIGMPYTINPCSTNGHECKQESFSHDKDNGSCNAVLDLAIVHETPPDNAAVESDDQNRKSQKKKRKAENEIDGCKRCNCKKSKCLKLYCECFAAGVYCVESCTCHGCFNKPIHEDTVLATRKQIESRNPLAFAPKVIRASEQAAETGDEANKTPASARHKRGCNCKKSNCLKKYCECFQGGAGCSMSCRCEGCRNTFGRKDGSIPMEMSEAAEQEKETNIFEKDKDMDIPDKDQDISILNKEESSENPLLITPSSQIPRPPVPMPFTCAGKPPRAVFSIGSSIRLNTSATLSKKEVALPDSVFNKNLQSSEEDSSDILRDNCTTPMGMVKVTSPNRKRISPPCSESGLSPSARKGCRKLILKSIPSFPSLISEANEHPTNISGSSFMSSLR